jgi:8-amino-7-oxononanoate synthase
VPVGTARLRNAFSAAHDAAQVDALADAVAACLAATSGRIEAGFS